MPTIRVQVRGKVATNLTPEEKLVCGNEDYEVEFDFDESWAGVNFKTGLFIRNGELIAQPFDGNICAVPRIENTTLLAVGVKSSDGRLFTTTPAFVDCLKSASDLAKNKIPAPTKDVYDEIIALINKYIGQGGGGSGGTDEERVREIVAEETAGLQPKSDENLQTESKEIVGAINEVKAVAETAKMVFGETEGTAYEGNKGKANAENIERLGNELAIVNVALEQSGLLKKYKQPITQEYNERVTADGLNVLDGSRAILKKVVGSTVACRNLVDIPFIDTTISSTKEISVNFSQDIFVSVGELATVSSSIWRFQFVFKDGTSLYIMDVELERGGKKISATADNPIVKIAYRGERITAGRYSRIMIEYGTTATEYQPYFTGLKSAYFGGIESGGKNLVDEQKPTSKPNVWNYVDGVWQGINPYYNELRFELSVRENQSYVVSLELLSNSTGQSRLLIKDGATTIKSAVLSAGANAVQFTATNTGTYTIAVVGYTDGGNCYFKNLQIEHGTTATEYKPYIKPNSLSFPLTQMPLGKTIDFEAQKVTDYGVELVLNGTEDFVLNAQANTSGWGNVYQLGLGGKNADINILPISDSFEPSRWGSYFVDKTNVVAVSTAVLLIKTDGVQTLDDFKAYLAQRYADGNPATIRYVSSTLQSENPMSSTIEYTAHKGGTEKVLGNEGLEMGFNNGAKYGAENTLTQDYIFVTEVK